MMKPVFGSIIAGLAVVAGCSQLQGSAPSSQEGTSRSYENSPSGSRDYQRSAELPTSARSAPREERAKLSFLQRIREADPQYKTIERAVMNESNELGIILSRAVSMDEIPTLMRSLLKQMAAQFPGENLTVIAYAPTDPPMPVGTGRLNAGTREMTYTPAQQMEKQRR